MQLVALFFGSLFAGVVSFLAQYLTKKLAITVAAIAAFAALTAGFYAALSSAMGLLIYSLPDNHGLSIGLWIGIPDIAPLCFSVAWATDVAVYLYKWNVTNIKLAVSAN